MAASSAPRASSLFTPRSATTCNPDLTILLLPSLKTSLARARRRNERHLEVSGTDENRFERESDDFYGRIHAAYLAIAVRSPSRVLTLTDDASVDIIELQIRAAVEARLAAQHH